MNQRTSFVPALVRRIPNAIILALLVALGAWGHAHHWQMPRFAEFTASHVSASPASTAVNQGANRPDGNVSPEIDAADSDSGRRPPIEQVAAAAGYPVIRFRSPEAVQKAEIQARPAHTRDLDEFVVANGVVEYDETRLAQLSPRVPGIAWRVEKRVGDPVRKGEVLAILDSSEVGKAKADLLEGVLVHDLKAETLAQLEKVSNSVPARTIREARAEERTASVRLFNAQQALINLGLPLPKDILTGLSDQELARRIQFLGIPAEMIARFDADVVTANLIPLTAPFDGVVIQRELVPGEVAQTGHAQFVIADVSQVWLRLNVRKADAARLAVGQEVWFASDGAPGEVKSRITWVAAEVDVKTRTVQVRAEAENPELESAAGDPIGQRLLRVHTFGTARIRVREERRAVVVPNSAIQFDHGQYLIFVPLADGRSFQPRAVSIGVTNNDCTEIISGLGDGEQVVTSGAYVLKAELGRERAAAAIP